MHSKSFWKGRRVLLTGHTGFKGSWMALWLLTLGAEVWGYSLSPDSGNSLFVNLQNDLSNHSSEWGELHHCLGDIRDLESLRQLVGLSQPEVVFHFAAQALVRHSYCDPIGTWSTNVQGSLNVLEALRYLDHECAVVVVTTDKVYLNQEWDYGYRECDKLGGLDPYSSSKAAAELLISSWRASFSGDGLHQTPNLAVASARAGNVIGGGDWAEDRIIPDVMRSLCSGKTISIRNPEATRPWQHVLEPLSGYILLAEFLAKDSALYSSAFNFGPMLDSNRSVRELVETVLSHWPGTWSDLSDATAPHEAGRLHLQIDKAYHQLGWKPRWSFASTVERTVNWYRRVNEGGNQIDCCLSDLHAYEQELINVL